MLDYSKSPLIMGILNYTDDSFSDGGLYNTPEIAIEHAVQMQNQGADIIDFGACSTRPGCKLVLQPEELSIIENLIPVLKNKISLPLSIDTFYVKNQLRSIELGVDIINDVGGVYNKETAYAVKNSNVNWIIMHGGIYSQDNGADDIVNSVQNFFDHIYEMACDDNIVNKIIFDPGFGFNKDTVQNKILLTSLNRLNTHGIPLLCALSRKRFIGELSDDIDSNDRLGGTLTANIIAIRKGASIIRVHDIYNHKKAINFLHNI